MIFSSIKFCKNCNHVKSHDEFYLIQKEKNKYSAKCKECISLYYKNNLEIKKKYQIQYKEANKNKLSIYDKEYYLKNKDKILEKQKQYIEKNKEIYKSIWANKSAKRRLNIFLQTPLWADKNKIKEIYDFAKEFRDFGINVDVDHIFPINSKYVSGLHTHENLRVCLSSVNRRKKNKIIEA